MSKNIQKFSEFLNEKYDKITILEGEDELVKPTKYGYVKVSVEGSNVEQYYTPEKVKLIMKYNELVGKGYNQKDLDEILELQKRYDEREERDSNID